VQAGLLTVENAKKLAQAAPGLRADKYALIDAAQAGGEP
jgi:hypothetical protein